MDLILTKASDDNEIFQRSNQNVRLEINTLLRGDENN